MTALSAGQATVASAGGAELYGSKRMVCRADLRVKGAVRLRPRSCIPGALVGVMLSTDTPYNAFFQNSEFTLDDLKRASSGALALTDAEDTLIAALAIIGDSSRPRNG